MRMKWKWNAMKWEWHRNGMKKEWKWNRNKMSKEWMYCSHKIYTGSGVRHITRWEAHCVWIIRRNAFGVGHGHWGFVDCFEGTNPKPHHSNFCTRIFERFRTLQFSLLNSRISILEFSNSQNRILELANSGTLALSNFWTFELSNFRTFDLSNFRIRLWAITRANETLIQ